MSKELNLHIKGEATVYRNDKWGYPSYSLRLSNQFDGIWENEYINVTFPRGQEIPNKTQIAINDGFLTFYKTKDDKKIIKVVVTSYDVLDEAIGDINIPKSSNEENFNGDLPF